MFEHEICINLTYFRFQRTKYFGGQNIRRTKLFSGQNFRQQVRFSAVLSAEISSDKVFTIYVKKCISFNSKILFKFSNRREQVSSHEFPHRNSCGRNPHPMLRLRTRRRRKIRRRHADIPTLVETYRNIWSG